MLKFCPSLNFSPSPSQSTYLLYSTQIQTADFIFPCEIYKNFEIVKQF